jgi:SAM-dependent methyltransferase
MPNGLNNTCRFCNSSLKIDFCDLGETPLSNSYVRPEQLTAPEVRYPLHAFVCHQCLLVQIQEFEKPEAIFSDYSYFSSYSDSWLEHAKKYAIEMIKRFELNQNKQVIEIASNDGYLLQFFKEQQIPILGIEPAKNVAIVAETKGIPTLIEFFGLNLATRLKEQGMQADLLVANNVLAHVPNLNNFIAGIKILLSPTGVVTIEFPHLLNLICENQFDTIYHEHFSYFSFHTVEQVFSHHGLVLFDVEMIQTHGGSLRIFAGHKEDKTKFATKRIFEMKELERQRGLLDLQTYLTFNQIVRVVKDRLINLLQKFKNEGKTVVAYGAPAKGNTLLNYCNVKADLIQYTVDRSPHKQGKYLPGSLIPIYPPEKIAETKPDYLVILPWNLKDEIVNQMKFIRNWGGQFVIPIPEPRIIA